MSTYNIRVILRVKDRIVLGSWDAEAKDFNSAWKRAERYSNFFSIEEDADEILQIKVNKKDESE